MPLKVAAFYQFAALPDFRELREPLRAICAGLGLKGSVLLAHEGINGTLAGSADAIDALIARIARRRAVRRPARQSRTEILVAPPRCRLQRLKIRLKKEIVTLGDSKTDPTKAVGYLCRCRRLERSDRGAGHAGDRHPQRVRSGDGQFCRRGRSRHQELRPVQGFRRARPRSATAPEDRDVLHRRHPLRKGQLLSVVARLCRGLSPQGRHPEISGSRAGRAKAAGAANVLCSTNGSRSAMACASAQTEDASDE